MTTPTPFRRALDCAARSQQPPETFIRGLAAAIAVRLSTPIEMGVPPTPCTTDGLTLYDIGELYATLLTDRHSKGAYYTPPELAQLVARQTLTPLLSDPAHPPTILDPAMGCGGFLLAAGEVLAGWLHSEGLTNAESRQRAADHLRGVDTDPTAVTVGRVVLSVWAGHPLPEIHFRVADALLDPPPGPFDAVVSNPPYLSVFARAHHTPEKRRRIGERYTTATGSYDIAVPFVEQVIRLLRDGGRCGLVLPNKLLAADYASVLRRWLRERATLHTLIDCTTHHEFAARVYPVALVLEKRAPTPSDPLQVCDAAGSPRHTLEQRALWGVPGEGWGGALSAEWPTLRRIFDVSVALREIATVSAGLTVGEAYNLRRHLCDGECPGEGFRLTTTGLIEACGSAWGRKPCRFLKGEYAAPLAPADALPARRVAQARAPKLIVAGLSKRPRAMVCEGGSLASVSTVIVTTSAWPLPALCALLNSEPMARLTKALYGALALSGGYMRFGQREIGRLPVPAVEPEHPAVVELAALARRRMAGENTQSAVDAVVQGLWTV